MGNHTGAVEAYTYSIAHNPYNVKALYNSAVIFEVLSHTNLLVLLVFKLIGMYKATTSQYIRYVW